MDFTNTIPTGQKHYELTTDPFALFSFALLVLTIFVFLILLTVTARRSAAEVWDSMRSPRRRRQPADLEQPPHEDEPLMTRMQTTDNKTPKTAGSRTVEEPIPSAKRVQFDGHVEDQILTMRGMPFEELFDEWHASNTRTSDEKRAKRKSMSERQFVEMHLISD